MQNTSGYTFGHLFLIVLLFASVISCNQDEILIEKYSILGQWKSLDVSDSINHYEHLLIFDNDSTFKYDYSSFIIMPSIEEFSSPSYLLLTKEKYVGRYFSNGKNLSMKADTQINIYYSLDGPTDTITIDSFPYEECKFEVVDTVLTIRYTMYRANTPMTSTDVYVKNDEKDLETKIKTR
jgi:hypothetical protein